MLKKWLQITFKPTSTSYSLLQLPSLINALMHKPTQFSPYFDSRMIFLYTMSTEKNKLYMKKSRFNDIVVFIAF